MISNNEPFKTIADFSKIRQLNLDKRHNVSLLDIKEKNFKKILEITYEQRPANFEKLLAIKGVGPKTIRALALISEIIYAKPASFKDPVRFSFAHGGKDGHPYPVDKKGYDLSIQILKDAVHEARLGRIEKMKAIKRLR
jgi:hypothetical protein